MKSKLIASVFILFAAGMGFTIPAFADHPTAEVSLPAGTSVPGCEETNECYVPAAVSIDIGGEVTWSNDDSAAHTVTSGTPEEGPDGFFDSSIFMAGTTYSVKFDDYTPGDYPYFCMVHPWMQGIVTVEGEAEEEHEEEEVHMEGEGIVGMTADGQYMITIWPEAAPIADETFEFSMALSDADGNEVEHVNHDIKITQNGEVVLDDENAHHMTGEGAHSTAPLGSADPVDIEITLQGFGQGDLSERTGPIGEKVVFSQVVPEFGTIAMMILGVAIVSIVAVTAKSRIIPRI